MNKKRKEGLQFARLLLVFSSISPLFVLWSIRGGNKLIPELWFQIFCWIMIIVPNVFLLIKIKTAISLNEKRELFVNDAEDHRDHLLVYLFAMLLPFYTAGLNSLREFYACLAALIFIIFLFWHLNMHYMNLLFALMGYRVFTISQNNSKTLGLENLVLITKRSSVRKNDKLSVYRISDTVYWEG